MIRLLVVKNQEAVVKGIGMIDGKRWILTVEGRNIRYRADVRVTDRIRWGDKTLTPIAPPYPLGGKKWWLVLECRELVEDG